MTNEIWKDIKGYEGYYQVSNFGRVKNIRTNSIKSQVVSKTGYWVVNLWRENKSAVKKTHRLIANAFIENPKKKKEVNHIDLIKTNNSIDNLEWVTHKENMDHARLNGVMKNTNLGTGKSINMFTRSGEYITTFDDFRALYEYFDIKPDGVIYKIMAGKRKGMRGYTFKYAE